jgi:hypothetical protein
VRRTSALALLALSCSLLTSAAHASPKPEQIPKWIAWAQDRTTPQSHHIAGLTFEMRVRRVADLATLTDIGYLPKGAT